MKKLLAVSMVIAAIFAVNGLVYAEVQFKSWNHAVFGGRIRLDGQSAGQKCSVRFDKGIEHMNSYSGRRDFQSTAILPCDLAGGGRLVIDVNGKPTEFQVPAGVITHGREVHIVVRHIPEVVVLLTSREADSDVLVCLFPQARGRKCEVEADLPWTTEESYHVHRFRERSYLESYLKQHPLPCEIKD